MKILLINWQDPANPRAGGAEIHLREIFSRIHARGHTVEWLVSGWRGAPASATEAGMAIHRAGSRYTFGVASVVEYRRRFASAPYDLVVEALNKVPVYSPLWAGRQVVLLVHHLFGTTAFQQAPFPLAAATWLQERPLRWIYGHTPVQAISHSTADDLTARGLERQAIRVINPGVDLDFFRPAPVPTRSILPTFVYIGRLERYKRVDVILRAFADVTRSVPRARLVIAGKGDQEEGLRKLASGLGLDPKVHFAGYVTEETKRDLFRSAWANVFTSPKEGWGITNIEAAACGTPSLASDSPGLRESVRDGRTGLLVPHGDIASLSAAMRRLATDVNLVESLGRAAATFAADFSWARAADATLEHLVEASTAGPTGKHP